MSDVIGRVLLSALVGGLAGFLVVRCQGPTAFDVPGEAGHVAAVLVRNNATTVQDVFFDDSLSANRVSALPGTKLCWARVRVPNGVHVGGWAVGLAAGPAGFDVLATDTSLVARMLGAPPC